MKSYPFTYLLKYLFPVLFLISIYVQFKLFGFGLKRIHWVLLVIDLWMAYLFLTLFVKLRLIQTGENGLVVKTLFKTQTIEYRNILWITSFDISCPTCKTLKYVDAVSGEKFKIAYLPPNHNVLGGKDELTKHILSKIPEEKPFHEDQPSYLKNLLVFILAGLVVFACIIFILFYM